MEECSICNVSGEEKRLFDAVSLKRIVKICESCSVEEQIPILKKPTTFQLRNSESEEKSFRERTLEFAKQKREKEKTKADIEKQNTTLKEIIEENVRKKLSKEERKKPRVNLIPNFHWIIMRARRRKKISQKELAEEIKEAEITIKMVEKGILPEDEFRLINKLENYLGIVISDEEFQNSEHKKQAPARLLDFKLGDLDGLTISDLQEIKKGREGD